MGCGQHPPSTHRWGPLCSAFPDPRPLTHLCLRCPTSWCETGRQSPGVAPGEGGGAPCEAPACMGDHCGHPSHGQHMPALTSCSCAQVTAPPTPAWRGQEGSPGVWPLPPPLLDPEHARRHPSSSLWPWITSQSWKQGEPSRGTLFSRGSDGKEAGGRGRFGAQKTVRLRAVAQ